MQRRQPLFAFVIFCVAILMGAVLRWPRSNTATLSGNVVDPQGLAVRGAKVSVTLLATGSERSVNADDSGHSRSSALFPASINFAWRPAPISLPTNGPMCN